MLLLWVSPFMRLFEFLLCQSGGDLLAQPKCIKPSRIRLLGNFVVSDSFGLEAVDRAKRLVHRRRLEHARGTDERAPNVGDFNPVGFHLGLDRDFATENGPERGHRGDRRIIRRALQSGCNIVDPGG